MAFRAFLLALLVPFSVTAAEVAGVKIDDKTRVADSDLALNGAGVRTRLFFAR
jgi:Chalcone isomerase-like